MNIIRQTREALAAFPVTTLQELQQAALMRRRDSKYLFHSSLLAPLLREVEEDYEALEVEGLRYQLYQTVYFDTPDLAMYHMHHSGRVNRHKVRFRQYGSTEDSFLEVKRKDPRGVTVKNRIMTESSGKSVLSREEEFLSHYTPYGNREISPVLENTFYRITLVSPGKDERITLDHNLEFTSLMNDDSLELPGVSIAEIKFSDRLSGSPLHLALRRAGIIPRRFSKYCTGMAMLHPELKQNLFKEKIRIVSKINQQPLTA